MYINDISGNKYGKLTVISFNKKERRKKNIAYYWNTKCDCGKESILTTTEIKIKKSCGCEKKRKNHHFSQSRFYKVWNAMKMRCNDLTNESYGKRGIIVCDDWLNFENFLKDMYISYKEHCEIFGEKQTTIDRIDNNKGYFKENCHWVNMKVQNNNKNNNIKNRFIIDINNKNISLIDFYKKYKIKHYKVISMLKNGYNIKEIIDSNGLESNIKLIIYKKIILNNLKLVNNFRENWKKVLFLRYGIEDNRFKTQVEISKILNLTKARIGQIESSALEKLLKLI